MGRMCRCLAPVLIVLWLLAVRLGVQYGEMEKTRRVFSSCSDCSQSVGSETGCAVRGNGEDAWVFSSCSDCSLSVGSETGCAVQGDGQHHPETCPGSWLLRCQELLWTRHSPVSSYDDKEGLFRTRWEHRGLDNNTSNTHTHTHTHTYTLIFIHTLTLCGALK